MVVVAKHDSEISERVASKVAQRGSEDVTIAGVDFEEDGADLLGAAVFVRATIPQGEIYGVVAPAAPYHTISLWRYTWIYR
ncbi:hypothetical protein IPM62_02095 [Candidatus Woesebacteria bacterium]|nr:MAG: hypothetical protein IPM62_02095 [Candidatus Woesebacteria bacterium]